MSSERTLAKPSWISYRTRAALRNECPECKATPNHRCFTTNGNRAKSLHKKRIELARTKRKSWAEAEAKDREVERQRAEARAQREGTGMAGA